MSSSVSGTLNPANKATSVIIDAFSNTKYVFWDVSVGFRICFPVEFLELTGNRWFDGWTNCRSYEDQELTLWIADVDFAG